MIHFIALFVLGTTALLFTGNAADHDETTPRVLVSPWDANAWEPGGAKTFWRVSVAAKKAKKTASIKSETSCSTDTVAPVTVPEDNATKSEFPNRQTEN